MESKINQKVLIVDDEPDIVELLEYNLAKAGYDVKTAYNGKQAIETAKDFAPDVILMDIMMPKMDGVEAGRILRNMSETADSYLIFLTARVEEYSEVAAFEVGADDYIIKPIRPRALISRIEALSRRERKKAKPVEEDKVTADNLVIDKNSYTVYKHGQPIVLPKKEFELLYFLAQNPNRVFTREDLLQNIWGVDVYVLARTVDVHIRKVREKIGEDYIVTIKGVGYKFANQKE
jgi:two-component system alkaline phosphatase synthesis response regulator PhoP